MPFRQSYWSLNKKSRIEKKVEDVFDEKGEIGIYKYQLLCKLSILSPSQINEVPDLV